MQQDEYKEKLIIALNNIFSKSHKGISSSLNPFLALLFKYASFFLEQYYSFWKKYFPKNMRAYHFSTSISWMKPCANILMMHYNII